ncbi:hypothetical protein TWF569_005127 [Orbilia oligospora]|uniref:Uncharacterized protein n=1 Tax=Orbilia oligospora TaxID=2813651 RepID=A0A7C8JKX4_ORBOL|nr:hypothetical protein TWF706_005270 [Orbilia oligospora]KAF3108685.1 hypothetical protein TWF102_010804 [Orbilia oligospora]KAF3110012.1 hypothetical protein TWF103_004838 [Orbilia oligospora]KAF3149512.1 hypothetical protein TWF569_005127 [Orbilia oligospora]
MPQGLCKGGGGIADVGLHPGWHLTPVAAKMQPRGPENYHIWKFWAPPLTPELPNPMTKGGPAHGCRADLLSNFDISLSTFIFNPPVSRNRVRNGHAYQRGLKIDSRDAVSPNCRPTATSGI